MTRIGVVGSASFYAPRYAKLISKRGGATLAGFVFDPDVDDDALAALGRPTRVETPFDCPVFESVEHLLDVCGLDGVIVATPTHRRANDAVSALRRGVPVLTAKPATISQSGADRIATVAAETETPAMTTTPARYDTAIRQLYERVQTGRIGDPIAIQATIRHDRVPESGIEYNAEHAPKEAGAVYAMGYYTADLVRWLSGSEPLSIAGILRNANTPHSTHPDTGLATVEFKSGAVASMRLQYSTDCREPLGNWEAEVVGTEGLVRTVHHGYEGIEWTETADGDRETSTFGRTPSPVLDRQLAAFIRAIKAGSLPEQAATPKEVTESIGLCEAWQLAQSRSTEIRLTK